MIIIIIITIIIIIIIIIIVVVVVIIIIIIIIIIKFNVDNKKVQKTLKKKLSLTSMLINIKGAIKPSYF